MPSTYLTLSTWMEYKTCKLVVHKRWPLSTHPLHLMTDNIKWTTNNGESNSPIIISLSDKKHVSLQHSTLFAVLHLENCPDVFDSTKHEVTSNLANQNKSSLSFNISPVVLMCTEEFLKHYGFMLSVHANLSFAAVTTFPLDRIVVTATTDETFEWINKQGFETGLIVSSTCSHNILVRCNDMFLCPPLPSYGHDLEYILQRFRELRVLECSPVQQGVLGISTSIVVVRSKDEIVLNDQNTEKLTLSNSLWIRIADSCQLKLLRNSQKSLKNQCELSTVFCSEKVAKDLEIKDGAFVNLFQSEQFDQENHHLQSNSTRVVKFQTISDVELCTCAKTKYNGEQSSVFCTQCIHTVTVSSSLWFNFMKTRHRPVTPPSIAIVQIGAVPENKALVYVRKISLSLVLSPDYSSSDRFDKSLIKVFNHPQIVRVGDIITIDVADDYDFYEAADAKSSRCKAIYYKIIGLGEDAEEGRCYLADVKHTSIYQDGTTSAYVPQIKLPVQAMVIYDQNFEDVPGLDRYFKQLRDVISPYLQPTRLLDHTCSVMLSGPAGCGKWSMVNSVLRSCQLHVVEIDCQTLVSDTPGASEAKINEAFRRAEVYAPCAIILRDIESIGMTRETGQTDNRVCAALSKAINDLPHCMKNDATFPVVVIAITSNRLNVVADIKMQFLHQIDIESPNEGERLAMIKHAARFLPFSFSVDYAWIAKHTAGFVLSDIWELMRKTLQASHARLIEKCAVGKRLAWGEEQCLAMAGVTSSHSDVQQALQLMQSERADTIGVPKIPEVKWDDIGGLEEVKSHILDTIQLPLDHPELLSTGLRRSGVLLYGPPGTGKTLLVKAVASQCSLSFLSVKGPELINMYVGQSEANVRRVFQRARDAAPCVVFFDELDALAPNRGRSGDSGGVMDRVVSQLLAELDGVNTAGDIDKQVVVIAASNRPDLIDQALLRPGRLDKIIYVGISENKMDKIKVLQAQTRKLNLSPLVDFEEIVRACPPHMTGADFYALTTEATLNSIRRRIAQLETSNGCGGAMEPCLVEQGDLLDAASNIVPSVNSEQLANYKRVKAEMTR